MLLATCLGILILGSCVLVYKQTRFEPVGFPDARFIQSQRAGESEGSPRLILQISGAQNDSGKILVSVYDDEDDFEPMGLAILNQAVPVSEQGALVSVPVSQLPPHFAVAAFHDQNDDGQLAVNERGEPTERYGFSQNARSGNDWPKFSDVAVARPTTDRTISITLK